MNTAGVRSKDSISRLPQVTPKPKAVAATEVKSVLFSAAGAAEQSLKTKLNNLETKIEHNYYEIAKNASTLKNSSLYKLIRDKFYPSIKEARILYKEYRGRVVDPKEYLSIKQDFCLFHEVVKVFIKSFVKDIGGKLKEDQRKESNILFLSACYDTLDNNMEHLIILKNLKGELAREAEVSIQDSANDTRALFRLICGINVNSNNLGSQQGNITPDDIELRSKMYGYFAKLEYSVAENYPMALGYANKMLIVAPTDYHGHFLMGKIYGIQLKYVEALDCFLEALPILERLSPPNNKNHHADVLARIGFMALHIMEKGEMGNIKNLEDYLEGDADASKLTDIEQKRISALKNYMEYLKEGYEKGSLAAAYLIGRENFNQGNYDSAKKFLESSKNSDVDVICAPSLEILASIYWREDKLNKVISCFEEIRNKNLEQFMVLRGYSTYILAESYFRVDNYPAAEIELNKIVTEQLLDDNPHMLGKVHIMLAEICIQQFEYDRAAHLLHQISGQDELLTSVAGALYTQLCVLLKEDSDMKLVFLPSAQVTGDSAELNEVVPAANILPPSTQALGDSAELNEVVPVTDILQPSAQALGDSAELNEVAPTTNILPPAAASAPSEGSAGLVKNPALENAGAFTSEISTHTGSQRTQIDKVKEPKGMNDRAAKQMKGLVNNPKADATWRASVGTSEQRVNHLLLSLTTKLEKIASVYRIRATYLLVIIPHALSKVESWKDNSAGIDLEMLKMAAKKNESGIKFLHSTHKTSVAINGKARSIVGKGSELKFLGSGEKGAMRLMFICVNGVMFPIAYGEKEKNGDKVEDLTQLLKNPLWHDKNLLAQMIEIHDSLTTPTVGKKSKTSHKMDSAVKDQPNKPAIGGANSRNTSSSTKRRSGK